MTSFPFSRRILRTLVMERKPLDSFLLVLRWKDFFQRLHFHQTDCCNYCKLCGLSRCQFHLRRYEKQNKKCFKEAVFVKVVKFFCRLYASCINPCFYLWSPNKVANTSSGLKNHDICDYYEMETNQTNFCVCDRCRNIAA